MNAKIVLISIASALVGGGIGFAAGWFIKEKLDDKIIADIAEQITIDEMFFKEKEKELKATTEDAKRAVRRYSGVEVNPVSIPLGTETPKKIILTEEQANKIRQNRVKENKPIVISAEEYQDETPGGDDDWDKMEYRYYPSADLLVDDINDVRSMDYTYEIGSEALDILRNMNNGEEGIVYIRNPYLGCDIQITVDWDEPNAEWYDVPDLNDMEGGVKG